VSKHPELTADRLRQLLDYDPESGLFIWKMSRRVKAGDVAGSLDTRGYVQITVDGKIYRAHRLAFLWMEGTMPPDQVDHINMTRTDNRWSNLRHAERWENLGNRPANSNSKSGIKGVHWDTRRGKWHAQIRSAGRKHHLGHFNTIEEAQAVYNFAAGLVFGTYAYHLSQGTPQ